MDRKQKLVIVNRKGKKRSENKENKRNWDDWWGVKVFVWSLRDDTESLDERIKEMSERRWDGGENWWKAERLMTKSQKGKTLYPSNYP